VPEPETVPQPAIARDSAAAKAKAIARATAGAIAYEDDGRMSVLFPPPGAITTPVGTAVARDAAEAPAAAPAPATALAAEPAPAPAPASSPALDREELYQDFLRRLRREVLEQREQIGELY
jgi:predicted component of type VI protein secretion system